MKIHPILAAIAVSLLLSGCVVGRRTVALEIPTETTGSSTKGAMHIAAVTDNRKFENKPAAPSTPSIDGDVTSMNEAQKSTMIGRQRNTYGKAMGDIALPAGDSVAQKARALVAEALKRRGYTLSDDASAPNTASVSIDEFWAWFTPGMWSVSFEARVYCTLELKRSDTASTMTIKGYGINRGQVAKDANWKLAFDRAFEDFLAKFGPELDKTAF